MFALLASMVLALAGHPTMPSRELIRDPAVLTFCRVLARKAVSERYRQEEGAFVVRTAEGIIYFVAWPPSGEKERLLWYGSFPEGTVAILHTHPAWLPEPSAIDVRTARATHVPVYVITVFRISKTTGDSSGVVVDGSWFDDVRAQNGVEAAPDAGTGVASDPGKH